MRILFFGDVVGRAGREALLAALPELRSDADFIIVNGENAAAGYGITPDIARQFLAAGVGCLTTGNHVWDQRQIIPYLATEPRLLRPLNYPPQTPGMGVMVYEAAGQRRILVANLMGRLFMDALDDPFRAIEQELSRHVLGKTIQAAVIDIHAEATSEKMALGHYLDGRVSAVLGTHTHVPTADGRVLARGTAYQTDVGMCGDYDSVVGMDKVNSMARFLRKMPGERLAPATHSATLCGCLIETDDATGLARQITPVRIGSGLA